MPRALSEPEWVTHDREHLGIEWAEYEWEGSAKDAVERYTMRQVDSMKLDTRRAACPICQGGQGVTRSE